MIILADQETSADLVTALTNGTTYASPAKKGVERKEIKWVDEIEEMLEPIHKEFAVYQTTIFQGNTTATVYYNETFTIPDEGVYSTYFLFGQHKSVEAPGSDLEDDIGYVIDEIFGDDDD